MMKNEINFKELGMEIIREISTRNSKNEKENNQLYNTWLSMYNGLTQGEEDRETQFVVLSDKHYPLGKVFYQLRKWIVENRELDIESVLEEIHKNEACGDMNTLADIVSEVFLEDIDIKYFKEKMNRQGWTWNKLINTYVDKQDCKVNRLLSIPYYKYIETRKIA